MQIDVKTSIVTGGGFNFYITDKNTSNFFVKLVINMSTNPIINRYVAIEEAKNYSLILKCIKPNGELLSLEGELIDEQEALFHYNLEEYHKDMIGIYKCEFWIRTIVSGKEEISTTAPFEFMVQPSIINDLDDIIEDPEQYPIYQELLNRVIDMEDGLEDADLSLYATRDYVDEEIEVVMAEFDNIEVDLSDYVTRVELNSGLRDKADIDTIPTRVSQLENDNNYLNSIPEEYVTDSELEAKGYLTEHQSLDEYAKKTEIPTNVSQLANDKNYLTSVPDEYAKKTEIPSLDGYATESYVTDKINQAQLEGGENEIDLTAYALKSDLSNLVTKDIGNANQITFSDGDTFQTKLDNGVLKGEQGNNGVGVRSITAYYQVSESNVQAPKTWETVPPLMTATNRYLWSYETIEYTEGIPQQTSARIIGIYGDKGETGENGITPTIAAGSVATGDPGSTAAVTANTSGTTTTFDFIIPRGEKGDKGDDGKDGLTTSVKVNNQTYNQSNGTITLPDYPTISADAESVDGLSFWTGTQTQYDRLTTKDANTVYLIKEG